ncbi:MAG: VOC family protein [Xanthomonadales bacterium]|nr:VOC family protein [Xanthomonadales bacterium]
MKNPIQVRDIDHVVIRVNDVERALVFYRDVLGCPVERVAEEIGLWQLRAGRSLIDLVPVDGQLGRMGGAGPEEQGHNMDHVCLRLDPWDPYALRDWLAMHDIDMGEVVSRYGAEGSGPSVYIADPEDNTVELKGPPPAT